MGNEPNRRSTKVGWSILIVSLLVLTVLVWIAVTSDEPDATAVQLVRLVLSWPVIVGALLLGFGIFFREEFGQFLGSVGTIRFPGGEIRTHQPVPQELDEENIPEEELEETEAALDEESEAFEALLRLAQQRHRETLYWFYKYLSAFLVPLTQNVLRWFAVTQGATKEFYDETWKPSIPDPKQRAMILSILLQVGVAQESGGVIRATDHGRRFLLFAAGRVDEALVVQPPTQNSSLQP